MSLLLAILFMTTPVACVTGNQPVLVEQGGQYFIVCDRIMASDYE